MCLLLWSLVRIHFDVIFYIYTDRDDNAPIYNDDEASRCGDPVGSHGDQSIDLQRNTRFSYNAVFSRNVYTRHFSDVCVY